MDIATMAGSHRPPKNVRKKNWLRNRARRLMRRRLSWRRWRIEAQELKRRSDTVTIYRGGRKRTTFATGRTPMPEVFCLDQNTEETVRFLAMMRNRVLDRAVDAKRKRPSGRSGIQGYFDFSTMHTIGVSAALVLAALYDRQKHIAGWKLSTIDEETWHPDVRFILRAVGFHQLLDMQPNTGTVTEVSGLRVLKFSSGDNADGPSVGFVQEALAEMLPDDAERAKLLYAEPYAGIFEAVLNSSSWAYPDKTPWDFPQLERWWVTGTVDLDANQVSFSVFDQGVTIPVSLPQWVHWGKLKQRWERFARRFGLAGNMNDPSNDGLAIALAAKVARTSTLLPQHGKGLLTMIEVAQRAKAGRLRILSRYGEYVWETGRKPFNRTLPHQIYGTLIEWTLDL